MNPLCLGYILINAAAFGALFAYVSGSSLFLINVVGLRPSQFGLVLAATSPGHIMVPGKLSVHLKMASPRRYRDPAYMGRIAGDIYGGRMRNSPELVQKHMRHVRGSSNYGYYLQLMAFVGWTSLPWLPFLPQPTLVMAGSDDPIVPLVNGRIMAKLIPDSQMVTLDDGHLFLLTSAQESARLITEFLGKN